MTTYQNDIGRTGQNLNETILTPANVNATQFGKLFSQSVDGQIYAQPLYLSNVTVGGASHNVVFVATENDSVYAFDADSNGGANSSPLWKSSMLAAAHGAAAGAAPVSTYNGADIAPVYGITGTPVIDPVAGTMYVVSATLESSAYVLRLHALDVTTGLERANSPVTIKASVPGTGNGSTNGTLNFDPQWENQRPGLLLLNGIVWIGFASHMDFGDWHGWILGYNATSLAQTGVYCSSPNGTGSGFWMSGGGLAADVPSGKPYGRIFVPTGNGDFNATSPYNNGMDFGDSVIKLDLTNGVPKVQDDFTTANQASLDSEDADVGSGGLVIIPTQTTGSYPNLLVTSGKIGTLTMLNRENLGGYNSTDNAVQEITNGASVWSSPAYYNGNVYYWPQNDFLKAFPLVAGKLGTPVRSTLQYKFPGATPAISANGNTNGIVWTIDTSGYTSSAAAILEAHTASNVVTKLYSSATNSSDAAGPAVKFAVPTVANGKVYVGTANQVDIYGLLGGSNQAATPVISPGSETFNNSLQVSITDATAGATIYYTTDNTNPTTSSTRYTGPITLTASATVKAVASATGQLLSPQASATYTDVTQVAPVTFSEGTGTYSAAQSVSLSDTTSGATIYYTLDKSTPTTSSAVYSTPISVTSTTTITAMAVAAGLSNSTPVANTYTIQIGTTSISFPSGFAESAGLMILNGSTQLNDSRLQLTDGLANEAGTAWYFTPINIQSFSQDFTFQLSNPQGVGITFAIQNSPQGSAALGTDGGSLGWAPITKSMAIKFSLFSSAGEGSDSTGLYVSGSMPTVPSLDLTNTGINLHDGNGFAVHMAYDGTNLGMTITDLVTNASWSHTWQINIPSTTGSQTAYLGFTGSTNGSTASQKVTSWSFTSGAGTPVAAMPVFSVAAGSYATAQSVKISEATAGASVYYTTNGTTPTTSTGTLYTGTPVSVGSTETLQAIAIVPNYNNSPINSAAYTITSSVAATPTFSVGTGTYASAQSVTISDATSGASIYYTTNNTTPTTSTGTLYSGAITVSASETLQAIAVATGYSNSAVASATYTINTPAATPAFSVGTGTYTSAQSVTISDATSGASIYYTTNNTTPTTSTGTLYSGAITVSASETLQAIAVANGHSNSAVASATYTINSNSTQTATPVIDKASGTYNTAQTVTLSDSSAKAVLYYTLNGAAPTTSSTIYTAPFVVKSSGTLQVLAVAPGLSPSAIANATYTLVVLPPTANPAAGTYTGLQTITLTTNTAGASTYYTTDGTTPTAHDNYRYTGPFTISKTSTVTAMSALTGFSNSPLLTAKYTITGGTAPPVFSVPAGTYSSAQTVTITDSTAGASIYYTTNNTTPTTTNGTLYSTAITVGASETLQAIAVASGLPASTVTSAAYTISSQAATPVITPAAGSYSSAQTISISDTTPGAKIYITTNGTMPTTSSTLYVNPFTVASNETITALAVAPGYTNSALAANAYTITTSGTAPAINFPTAFNATGLSFVGGSAVTGGALALTDGGVNETRAAWYTTPVNVQKFTTDFNFQITNASADGFMFVLQNVGTSAIGDGGGELGYGFIGSSSVGIKFDIYSNNGEGTDSTGIYHGGAVPSTPAVDMSASGVTLLSGDVMHAHVTYDGTTLTLLLTDTVTNASFTTSQVINLPSVLKANTAYAGFTAGTGVDSATQTILNWTYAVN